MHFKYTLELVQDGRYGSSDNGRWNGMVGDLVDKVRITGYKHRTKESSVKNPKNFRSKKSLR